jgi:hypothetical protein
MELNFEKKELIIIGGFIFCLYKLNSLHKDVKEQNTMIFNSYRILCSK